jgi:predicted pyridoxine 5'-phosphate oxidase superfamily flavin-nucleotide-binding protein
MKEKAKVRLTEDMKRVLNEQRLGFIASVCPDGTPNLSPKGTTAVWDDEHLIFADSCSPGTVANLQQQPIVEINVVDPVARKGYRFKGQAIVYEDGPLFEQALAFYRQRGTTSPIRHIVLVKVERAVPLISPAMIKGRRKTRFAKAGCVTGRRSITSRVRRQVHAHDLSMMPLSLMGCLKATRERTYDAN